MQFTRRRFGQLALGAAAAPALARPVFAKSREGVIMLAWPGGTSAAWNEHYLDPFHAKTDIPVKMVEMGDVTPWYMGRGSEFNTVISNPASFRFYQRGKIEPISIADFPVLQKVDKSFWTPVDDDHLLGMPVYQQAYGIAINTDYVAEGEITRWSDLAKPEYKGKTAIGDYAHIYEVPWFAKLNGGDEDNLEPGFEMYREVVANVLTIPGSMSQMMQLLQRGDVIAAPFYSARIWDMIKKGATNIKIVFPEEGVPLLPYHLEMSKAGPDLDAARAFLAYSGGAGPAERVAGALGYFPVNADASYPDDFEAMMGLTVEAYKARLRRLDYVKLSANGTENRDRIDQINAQVRN